MKAKTKINLAKCRAEYLGREVPLQTNEGADAVYGPVRELFRRRKITNYKGTDCWLRVFSSGIAIHFLYSKKVDFIPIANMKMCAAIKCYGVDTDDITGQRTTVFGPLTSNSETDHPALFAIIVRRPWGLKVQDCLVFACRSDAAAKSLVSSCQHAYHNSDGWNKPRPHSRDIIKEDTKFAKKMKKKNKKEEGSNAQVESTTVVSNGVSGNNTTYVHQFPESPRRSTQSLPGGPIYYPRYYPVAPHPQMVYSYPGMAYYQQPSFDRMSAYQSHHYAGEQKEFSINGIVMEKDEGNDEEDERHDHAFSVNGQSVDYELGDERRPMFFRPVPLYQPGFNARPNSASPRLFHSMYDITGREKQMPFANVTLPPPEPVVRPVYVPSSTDNSPPVPTIKVTPPTEPQPTTNMFEVRMETYSGEKDMRGVEEQTLAMAFDVESVAGTIPKRIHAPKDEQASSLPALVSAGVVASGHSYSPKLHTDSPGPAPTVVTELVPTTTATSGVSDQNSLRSSVHVTSFAVTTRTEQRVNHVGVEPPSTEGETGREMNVETESISQIMNLGDESDTSTLDTD